MIVTWTVASGICKTPTRKTPDLLRTEPTLVGPVPAVKRLRYVAVPALVLPPHSLPKQSYVGVVQLIPVRAYIGVSFEAYLSSIQGEPTQTKKAN